MSRHSKHRCPICGKEFGRAFDLKRHQRSKKHTAFKAPDDVAKMQQYHQDKLRRIDPETGFLQAYDGPRARFGS